MVSWGKSARIRLRTGYIWSDSRTTRTRLNFLSLRRAIRLRRGRYEVPGVFSSTSPAPSVVGSNVTLMNLEARLWLVDWNAVAQLDSFPFFWVMRLGCFSLGFLWCFLHFCFSTPADPPGQCPARIWVITSLLEAQDCRSLGFDQFRPPDALLSPEPGGGKGNLSTHNVAQDCLFFCFVVLVLHFQLDSSSPRGSEGRGNATFPFRVFCSVFIFHPRHTGGRWEVFGLFFFCHSS